MERVVPKFVKEHGRDPRDGDVLQVLQPNFVRDVLTIPTIRSNDFEKNYNVKFSNPKNPELIKVLLQLVGNADGTLRKDLTVLDFYAGSGTTIEAVMELNKNDGGNRKCILCTINDDNGANNRWPNGLVLDCTYPRLRTIMVGDMEAGWLKKHKPYQDGLDVFDIKSILPSKVIGPHSVVEEIDETLYGKEKFSDYKDKVDWICENFDHAPGLSPEAYNNLMKRVEELERGGR